MDISDYGICVNGLAGRREQTPPIRNQVESDRAAAETALLWQNGTAIKVYFLNGSQTFREAVRRIAPEWSRYAKISFDFDATGIPDITINFEPLQGYYGLYNSFIGQASRGRVPSMNLVFPPGTTDERVLKRYILHEFGHALGLIHEHQGPGRDFRWNERAVIDWFRTHVGWDEEMVRQQVLIPYETKTTSNTRFDSQSIMLYPVYAGWASSGLVTGWNDDLSDTDRKFIGELYPRD